MARLYDKIMAGRFNTFGNLADLTPDSYKRLRASQVIVADNVTEFFFAGSRQEFWDYERDFPNLAPPFKDLWIETRRPSKIMSEVFGETASSGLPHSWGVFMRSEENPDPYRDLRWRWRVNAYLWSEVPRTHAPTGVAGPLGGLAFFVDKEGLMVDMGPGSLYKVIGFKDTDGEAIYLGSDQTEKSHSGVVTSLLDPLLLAICFMHCKNVATRAVTQPEPLNKKWQKKHGQPLVRYHVLDIDPMKEVLEIEGGIQNHGIQKALHICRGHFAMYTETAPLFGRVVGTFWKPQHVRGSARHGIVIKDYNVKAPQPQETHR